MRTGWIQLSTAVTLLLAAPGARAETAASALPVERAIDERVVSMTLRESRVEVLIDPGADPVLLVDDLLMGDDSVGFVLLEPDAETLRVKQPHGTESVAPRLSVRLVIRPEQKLELEGYHVDVTIRSVAVEDAAATTGEESPAPTQGAGTPRSAVTPGPGEHTIRLQQEGGTIELEGVGKLQVTAFDTQIAARQTRGLVDLAVSGGDADLRHHSGPLRLTGERSRFQLRDVQGSVSGRLQGGAVTVYGGAGRFRGSGEDGEFLVQNWAGPLDFSGTLHRINVLESGPASKILSVRGGELETTVSNFAGAIIANLAGGSLNVLNLGGRAKVDASQGARVRLENIQDTVTVKLLGGSDCIVQTVGRTLQAKIEDSRLDARDIRQSRVTALRSFVFLEDVKGKADVNLTDAEAELGLDEMRGSSTISLQGRSDASVVMAEPCAVRGHTNTDESLPQRATVDGCQLIAPGEQYRTRISSRTGGSTPSVLTATIGEDSNLEVRGR